MYTQNMVSFELPLFIIIIIIIVIKSPLERDNM